MKVNISDHFTYQKLIRFTIPTIFMMFFTSIYGVVDGIFVSNIVGKEAFAAVNLIMPAIMIMGAVGFMIGTGGSAIVSKTLGEGNHQKANEYFTMLILLEVVIGVLLSVVSMFFIDDLAKLFGATGELLENCIIYGKVLIIGNTFFLLQNSFQSFMIVLWKLLVKWMKRVILLKA